MKKRTGAASFYIVIFSTLLLTVIAVAFTTSVLSETNRTIDSDLSQSAYDSALAGVEDAKIAIARWKECQGKNDNTCKEINELMNSHRSDCDVVAKILGRIGYNDSNDKGTFIQETTTNNDSNNMEQAYTCVTLETDMYDYRSTLTSDKMTHVVPLKVANADGAKSIRISWYSDTDGTVYNYQDTTSNGAILYPRLLSKQVATPPTISVQLIQTASEFTIEDLDRVSGNTTNRGTLFFTPTFTVNDGKTRIKKGDGSDANSKDGADYYDITTTYNSEQKTNVLSMGDSMNFVTSNQNQSKNIPISVLCPKNSGAEFACSVSIELPSPVANGEKDNKRNPDTFMLAISLPYGRPDTDFSVEVCSADVCYPFDATSGSKDATGHLPFIDAQISIDSTGRANDLYRRVEARVENTDPYFPVPTYAVQLDGSNASMNKSIISSRKSSGSRAWEN